MDVRRIIACCSLLLGCYAPVWSQEFASDDLYRLPPASIDAYSPVEAQAPPAAPMVPEFTAPANYGPANYAPAYYNPANYAPAAAGPAEPIPPPAQPNGIPPGGYYNNPPLTTPLPNGNVPNQPPPEALPPAANAPAPAAMADDAAATTTDAVVEEVIEPQGFWYTYFDPWDGNVELGMNGTEGNTQTFNLRLGANAKYTGKTMIHSMQAVYVEKSVNGVNTAQNALLDGRIEWPWDGSPWNLFIHGLGEYDEFKAFDARLSGDAGIGYDWIKNDFTTFKTRGGIAASHEIGGPENDIIPEFLAGMEYSHKFSDTHSISFKTDYYPAMQDAGDFRLNTQASWEMAVAPDWGLSLKLSVIDRYDSTPHGAKPNDLDYSTLLIWGF